MNVFKRIKELEKKVAALELVLQAQPQDIKILGFTPLQTNEDFIEEVKKSILKAISDGARNIQDRTPLNPL